VGGVSFHFHFRKIIVAYLTFFVGTCVSFSIVGGCDVMLCGYCMSDNNSKRCVETRSEERRQWYITASL
jgi:hypothetical protein